MNAWRDPSHAGHWRCPGVCPRFASTLSHRRMREGVRSVNIFRHLHLGLNFILAQRTKMVHVISKRCQIDGLGISERCITGIERRRGVHCMDMATRKGKKKSKPATGKEEIGAITYRLDRKST